MATRSKSLELEPGLDPIYRKKPAATSTEEEVEPHMASLSLQAPITALPAAKSPSKVPSSTRGKRKKPATEVEAPRPEEDISDKLRDLTVLLISHIDKRFDQLEERVERIEEKVEKLQTDIAFMSSKALEGRPFIGSAYPLGKAPSKLSPVPAPVAEDTDLMAAYDQLVYYLDIIIAEYLARKNQEILRILHGL